MTSKNVDEIAKTLAATQVSLTGVSFTGKSLKLNSIEDASPIIDEINKCSNLQFLNLEGNTLGVEASKGIAKALEAHPELRRALWKDMFTGRMKAEIPKSLEFLGNGLVAAGTKLTELDLSDNAFGPIGVEGLAGLLRSSSCHALEELRLNNNGLGISGGKLLATALTDCYTSSKKNGKPLTLKVFIAGRNRLENDGATALAKVFKMIGTLEEIAMPQNGIYHVGVAALSEAFIENKSLQILNLNDNTLTAKGAAEIAKALPHLQNLREINFGDCLLKTEGVILLANALINGHEQLEELNLGHNELKLKGALKLIETVANKPKLKILNLNGNQFGSSGKIEIQTNLKKIGKFNTLGSLSEDESENSEVEPDDSLTEPEEEIVETNKTINDFINIPSSENFIGLGDLRNEIILKEAKKNGFDINFFISLLMKVASLTCDTKENVSKAALHCSDLLLKELFMWSENTPNSSVVNNTLLVQMGLIKSEDKKFKPSWNLNGCFKAVENVITKNYISDSTKTTLTLFLEKSKIGKK